MENVLILAIKRELVVCQIFLKRQVSFFLINFAKITLENQTAFLICYLKESWFPYMRFAHKNLGFPNSNTVQ